jgi:uncharacterized protein
MRHEIFVDASAWIAVSDSRDKYHDPASEEYRQLVREQWNLVTTNLVIAEVYLIIRRTGGHAQAMRFLRSLKGSPRLIKIFSDPGTESSAEEILEKYTDQDFSYVDAVSFSVMREQGIEEAFTFDRHFLTMGFRRRPPE